MTDPVPGANDGPDKLRLTFWIAIVGIGAVLLAFALALLAFHDADDPGELIPAVIGSVVGAIGTLAGLVAGHTAGAAGKEHAERRAEANERDASAGRALAQTLTIDGPAPAGAESELERFGPSTADPSELARRHAELARRLFPGLHEG